MKRWLLGLATLIAISFVGVATASAQGYGGFGCGVPYGGSGYGAGYGGYSPGFNNYGSGYGSYGGGYSPGYGGYGGGYGGRAGHYDYHAPTVRLHRGHLDYSPGHYDYHRSGHHRW